MTRSTVQIHFMVMRQVSPSFPGRSRGAGARSHSGSLVQDKALGAGTHRGPCSLFPWLCVKWVFAYWTDQNPPGGVGGGCSSIERGDSYERNDWIYWRCIYGLTSVYVNIGVIIIKIMYVAFTEAQRISFLRISRFKITYGWKFKHLSAQTYFQVKCHKQQQ